MSCLRRLTESFSLALLACALEEAGLWRTRSAEVKFDLGIKAKHSDLAMLVNIERAMIRAFITGSDPDGQVILVF